MHYPHTPPNERETNRLSPCFCTLTMIRRWQLLRAGLSVAQGGPYSSGESEYQSEIVATPGAYEFAIYDSASDGLCCGYGNGYYEVRLGAVVIAQVRATPSSNAFHLCAARTLTHICISSAQVYRAMLVRKQGAEFASLKSHVFNLPITTPSPAAPPPSPTAALGAPPSPPLLPPVGNIPARVVIKTDRYPGETTFEVMEVSGDSSRRRASEMVILRGGPFAEGEKTYEFQLLLESGHSYLFKVLDLSNDGICCGYGEGSFEVIVNGDILVQGGEFGRVFESMFEAGLEASPSPEASPGPSPYLEPSPSPVPSPSPDALLAECATDEATLCLARCYPYCATGLTDLYGDACTGACLDCGVAFAACFTNNPPSSPSPPQTPPLSPSPPPPPSMSCTTNDYFMCKYRCVPYCDSGVYDALGMPCSSYCACTADYVHCRPPSPPPPLPLSPPLPPSPSVPPISVVKIKFAKAIDDSVVADPSSPEFSAAIDDAISDVLSELETGIASSPALQAAGDVEVTVDVVIAADASEYEHSNLKFAHDCRTPQLHFPCACNSCVKMLTFGRCEGAQS